MAFPYALFAQEVTISGRVLDDKNLPVEYASLELFETTDTILVTGGITNKKGVFQLKNIAVGTYYLRVKFIGFEDKIISAIEVSKGQNKLRLNDITLVLSSIEMDEVIVETKRASVKNTLDKKIIRINEDISDGTENAIEILEKAPSLSLDIDGNLLMRGNANVTILIDGVPVIGDDNNVLSTLPASTIDNIEIITNPSAKYQSDGTAGIINIKSKKSKVNNLNVLTNLRVGTDNKYAANVNALYKKNKYSFHGQLNYSDFENYANSFRTRTIFNDTDTIFFRDDYKNRRYYDINNYVAIGNGLNFKNFNLFLNTKYGLFELYKIKRGLQQQWTENPLVFNNLWNINEGSIKWNYLENTFNLQYTSENGKHDLAMVLFHSYEDGRDIYNTATYDVDEQVNQVGEERSIQSRQDGIYRYYQGQVDYAFTIDSTSTIETGVFYRLMDRDHLYKQGEFNTDENVYEFFQEFTNDISISHSEYAGYVNYRKQKAKLEYQIGLRVEVDNRDITTFSNQTERTFPLNLMNVFPSVSASYKLNEKLTYRLSFSRRKKLPRPWQIVPYSYSQDNYITYLGNAELKPEFANKYETGLLIKTGKYSGEATLYLNDTNDEIWNLTTVGDDLISRFQLTNVDKHIAAGLELDNTIEFSKTVLLNLGGSVYSNYFRGAIQDIATTNENIAWNVKARLNFKILKDTQLMLLSTYNSEYAILQGSFAPYYFTNFSVRQHFFEKKMSANITFNDILRTNRFARDWEWVNFDGNYANRRRQFILMGITYNFNKYNFKDKSVKLKRGAL
ncbi:MAG: TonB-dependent receptor [Bacteroidota bacterium]